MAQYTYDVTLAPSGLCPNKLARELKAAIPLARKPKFIYAGSNLPGTDNLATGEITFTHRTLTTAELLVAQATIAAHVPCPPNSDADKEQRGIDLDDLEDYLNTAPGTILYVRDLPRLTGGIGTIVFRNGTGFRRVSDDSKVDLP